MTLFVHTAHLWWEDRELFDHEDSSFLTARQRATEDVLRDLERKDVDTDDLVDDFAKATVTLKFAASGGELTVPAGTIVTNVDPTRSKHAGVHFKTDAELVVADGNTGTVDATAVDPGAPGNVEAESLTSLLEDAPANFDTVTNPAVGSGGKDHQVTRAATYRAMELIYLDLMRTTEDSYGQKRVIYAQMYRDEMTRTMSAGLELDTSGDGSGDTEVHSSFRFKRA